MKKRILIHSIVFSPDGVSTAYLYNDIALGFKDRGYEVVVVTTTPHYNVIESEVKKQPLSRRLGGLYYKSYFHGIPVYHVPQKKFKSFLARAFGFMYWHVVSLFLGIFLKNISVILAPSPPLTIGVVSIFIARLKKAKVVYNVQEIYPDLLVEQGSLKVPFLIRLLRRLERFVYNHSDMVITIDDVFYKTIEGRFKDNGKLKIIPNFVDTDVYTPEDPGDSSFDTEVFKDNGFLKVMYAGNIGHAQDWAPLIAVAKITKDLPISFWVIGEGVLKNQLEQDIREQQLTNVHLLPYQPREKINTIVNFADLHFIFMNPKLDGHGFPSKVYTIMACKKPLLAVSGEYSPLFQFLNNKGCAFLITESNMDLKCEEIVSVLKRAVSDRALLRHMGERAIEVIESTYSKKAVVKQYIDICDTLLAK